jgi:hypothetical protein
MRETTHLHPVAWLRMSGTIPLLPSLPSRRGKGKLHPLSKGRRNEKVSMYLKSLLSSLVIFITYVSLIKESMY